GSSPATSPTRTRASSCTRSTGRGSARSRSPASAAPPASAAGASMARRSTRSRASPRRRGSTATTSRPAPATSCSRRASSSPPPHYETRRVFTASRDGTRVPMFLTARKGVVQDGKNPTYLYGYGGFNIPLTPQFEPSRLVWMELGGILAVANLRGGGEYGEEW